MTDTPSAVEALAAALYAERIVASSQPKKDWWPTATLDDRTDAMKRANKVIRALDAAGWTLTRKDEGLRAALERLVEAIEHRDGPRWHDDPAFAAARAALEEP